MKRVKGKWVFTDEDDKYLIDYIRQGGNAKALAKELNGPNVKTIIRKLKLLGLKLNGPKFNLTKEQEEYIISEYLAGKNIVKIAKLIHKWPPHVRDFIKSSGVKMRRNYGVTEEQKETAIYYYTNSKLTNEEIQQKAGISYEKLRKIVVENNLKRKHKAEFKVKKRGPFINKYIEKYGEELGRIEYAKYVERYRKNSSGKNNPMYGKPTPKGAGNGWKGWYKGIYFRSLRELCFMIDCDEKGIKYESAERKKFEIKYKFNGADRTYKPDFLVGNKLIEIKPIRLHKTPNIIAKKEAAEQFCKRNGLIYELIDQEIDKNKILEQMEIGKVKFEDRYRDKFLEFKI